MIGVSLCFIAYQNPRGLGEIIYTALLSNSGEKSNINMVKV